MPKEESRRRSRRNSLGRETDPGEIIYFKLYRGKLPV
jgi:hypothetical protein